MAALLKNRSTLVNLTIGAAAVALGLVVYQSKKKEDAREAEADLELAGRLGSSAAPITEMEVLSCQAAWAGSIMHISSVHAAKGDYVAVAAAAAGELYAYGHHDVLFKPTKATKHPFRPTAEKAMSYFVGGKAIDEGYDEDKGFAINGGKGFRNVELSNHRIDLNGDTAIAMGTYEFTCATTGEVSDIEYTFGYRRCADGKPRIFLHHSSEPFTPDALGAGSDANVRVHVGEAEYTFAFHPQGTVPDGKPRTVLHHSSVPPDYGYADSEVTIAPEPVSRARRMSLIPMRESDVMACQDQWAASIMRISNAYMAKGDFVSIAAAAAGELYAYGHHDVLFKPTKATKHPFRPTATSAMSYFVGGKNVNHGYDEDKGFAINSGKGFSKVELSNHRIDLNGDTAIAMGTYEFTCATTGKVSDIEYTFGYRRCADGKPRIFLHHSSVPHKPPQDG